MGTNTRAQAPRETMINRLLIKALKSKGVKQAIGDAIAGGFKPLAQQLKPQAISSAVGTAVERPINDATNKLLQRLQTDKHLKAALTAVVDSGGTATHLDNWLTNNARVQQMLEEQLHTNKTLAHKIDHFYKTLEKQLAKHTKHIQDNRTDIDNLGQAWMTANLANPWRGTPRIRPA